MRIRSIGNRRFNSIAPCSAPSLVVNSAFSRPSTSRAKPDLGSSIVWPGIRNPFVGGKVTASCYGEPSAVVVEPPAPWRVRAFGAYLLLEREHGLAIHRRVGGLRPRRFAA